ncbi:hypothetical protein PV755_09520 [Streptomyces caniscabiei]|uniref:Uncharacterized protein n=1 Tax=Streptomyces caniscabiei TaxID=2746961 RepID=A0A927KYB3_9ACTN|nr:hypothetical protein [Streptomyces caniscabiei]MBD9721969.1 hypothetical protein [Streptomyces caniscabiei]MDX3509161.1 hypothetical protein [Streptomyces caniscabiei]MDX3717086.1 hypothetical protein [Streptomyces caniscabiei]WEO22954.1 hypothetical protein IHE65_07205 [Streptomyces caniscabiei]
MAVIPATSIEYLHVPVTATPAGTSLTGTPVKIAAVAHRNNPGSSEWHTASWDGTSARILIGPGTDLALTAGDYRVWIHIDPPGAEAVVRRAGILTVT